MKRKIAYDHRKKPVNLYTLEKHNRKIEGLSKEIKQLINEKKSLSESQSTYISMLANFASHDLKNAIQSMDTILFTNTIDELTSDHVEALKANLKMMRESMNNFSELAPHSEDSLIDIQRLISTVISINRDGFTKNNIKYSVVNDVNITFKAAFHAIAGIINNIIINAIKALAKSEIIEKSILILYGYDEEELENGVEQFTWFKIYDNADKIPFDILDKIFDYGFSTNEDGSGVGLYHVYDVCSQYQGTVTHEDSDLEEYTKYFYIRIPVLKERDYV